LDLVNLEFREMLRIRWERLRRGWTQTALAYKARLSASDVSKIETGMLRPYPKQARALGAALQVPTNALLEEVEGRPEDRRAEEGDADIPARRDGGKP
jgi:ribosome-binding protein aMBF1 (putative translation factor)